MGLNFAGDLAVAFEGPDSIEVRHGGEVGRGFLDDGEIAESVGFGVSAQKGDRVLWLRLKQFPALVEEEELEIKADGDDGSLTAVRALEVRRVDSVFWAVRIGPGS